MQAVQILVGIIFWGLPMWNTAPPSPLFKQEVEWISWEEAQQRMQEDPRKIFVDVYTDWCGWCKVMDRNTFQEAYIAQYLNEHFYCIKFNAEQKEAIRFKGKIYKYVNRGRKGYHELAAEITNGRLSYPTVVFLNEQWQVIQPIPGYQKPEKFEQIMTYFATGSYKTTPWGVYQEQYQSLKDP